MLYHLLYPLHTVFSGFNVFRYITFRCIGATLTAFLILLLAGPRFIKILQRFQIGQVVREDGPATHFSKKGVPTMGGLLIIFAVVLTTLLWVDLVNPYVSLIDEILSLYRAGGLTTIQVGIEALSPGLLKKMNKGNLIVSSLMKAKPYPYQ